MHCDYHAAGRCRSCTHLDIPYADQLAAKDRHCRALLGAHGGAAWLPPAASPEAGFRNKAKMVVGGSTEAPLLGILDSAGRGVDLAGCPLYPAALQAAFAPVKAFIAAARVAPYDVAHRRGELKYVLVTLAAHSGELMLRFVLRSQEPLARMRRHLPELHAALPALRVVSANLQPVHQAVLEGEQEIALSAQQSLAMRVNGLPLHLRPQGFFQTNDAVAAALYRQAREWTRELAPASLWDLYCGVGGFALHCAEGAHEAVGVEASAEAVAAAERSRDELGLGHVRFVAQDATAFALAAPRAPELAIVNPPRRGLDAELCAWLDASGVRAAIYSSCNAETLARDLARMPRLRLARARVLDMFPHTAHYEVVALLLRA
ncbi:MAG: 23S rRNA (uracil(747)-C(5))-methyltransferase RlmC [Mizugakiibacter sp.]|uniref:23S rRNA (uracil(747)-C(5))-methyltransferase RlmC n=1 Tax=Mizugakiibacter sp. TaxID=1972610 RepID=UPI0031BDACB7|nr:23S rRNA (uracil(747)-C(5))-methyltransferase RlmC [Xanthomonadaceae bacterium]